MLAKVIGISDEVTTCECCGRTNLKRTVVLELGEGFDPAYYGSDCATRKLLGNNKSGSKKSIESIANGIQYARKWLKLTEKHTADIVANAIRVRFTNCWINGDYEIEFSNGVKVKA